MNFRFLIPVGGLAAALCISACADKRLDPCTLLSPEEVRAIDSGVSYSLWAGRGGERREDEVCVFYTKGGDARVMLFVWYEADAEPDELVAAAVGDERAEIVEVPGSDTRAVAALDGDDLKLLAVESPEGVVGLRVRREIARDSSEFEAALLLARTALSRRP